MVRKILIISTLFILVFVNKAYAQINGDLEICRNSSILYYYTVSGLMEGESVSWSPTSGTVVSASGSSANIRWNTNSSNLKLTATYKSYSGYVTHSIYPTYREIGALSKIQIVSEQTSYCSGDTIYFIAKSSGELQNQPSYFWYIYKEGNYMYSVTTASDTLEFVVPDNYNDSEIQVKARAGNGSLSKNHQFNLR